MPLRQTEAFVLRTYSLKETDKIVSLFTRDHGKVRAVARGAKRFRSTFGANLEPFTRLRVIYFEREGKDLVTLDSCDRLASPHRRMGELEVNWHLAWLAEVVEQIAPEHDAQPVLFRLLTSLTEALEAGAPPEPVARYFEIWALRLQGVLPDLRRCGACGGPLGERAILRVRDDVLACERCEPAAAGSVAEEAAPPILRARDREFAESVLKQPIAGIVAAAPSAEVLDACARAFGDLLERYVGKPLRSRRFLDELRRLPR